MSPQFGGGYKKGGRTVPFSRLGSAGGVEDLGLSERVMIRRYARRRRNTDVARPGARGMRGGLEGARRRGRWHWEHLCRGPP